LLDARCLIGGDAHIQSAQQRRNDNGEGGKYSRVDKAPQRIERREQVRHHGQSPVVGNSRPACSAAISASAELSESFVGATGPGTAPPIDRNAASDRATRVTRSVSPA